MRTATTFAALLAAALSVSTGAAAATLKPPVVHEVFTPLQCPMHPQTTIALEGCTEQAILASDRQIDARAKAIFGLLRTTSARRTFVQSEREWLRYRNTSCAAQASLAVGGTLDPVEVASCDAARNRTHVTDLTAMEHALRSP